MTQLWKDDQGLATKNSKVMLINTDFNTCAYLNDYLLCSEPGTPMKRVKTPSVILCQADIITISFSLFYRQNLQSNPHQHQLFRGGSWYCGPIYQNLNSFCLEPMQTNKVMTIWPFWIFNYNLHEQPCIKTNAVCPYPSPGVWDNTRAGANVKVSKPTLCKKHLFFKYILKRSSSGLLQKISY